MVYSLNLYVAKSACCFLWHKSLLDCHTSVALQFNVSDLVYCYSQQRVLLFKTCIILCLYVQHTGKCILSRWRYSLVIYICNFYKKAMWYVYKHVGYQLYKLHHLSTSPTLLLSFICANTYIHTNTCTHTRHSLIITTSTTKAHKYAVY